MQPNRFLGPGVNPFFSKQHGSKICYLHSSHMRVYYKIIYIYNVVLKVCSKFVTMSIDARYKWGMPLLDLSMHKSSSYI